MNKERRETGISNPCTDSENMCTSPFIVDWNGDGHLDIVTGNSCGTFILFEGRDKGVFSSRAVAISDPSGTPLKLPKPSPKDQFLSFSHPHIVDWDGDGYLDILASGSAGDIYWWRNISEDKEFPEFSKMDRLVSGVIEGPNNAVRIDVVDFNGDGKLDILCGDKNNDRLGNIWVILQKN